MRLALTVLVLYMFLWTPVVLLHPNHKCHHPRCQGGKLYAKDGVNWRRHWWCGGKGDKRRWRWWRPFDRLKLPD